MSLFSSSRAAVAVGAFVLLTACGTSAANDAATSSAPTTRTVSTVFGDVQVPATPQRVAAVSYDTPWQLQSLDVRPIATIDYSRWTDQFTPEQLAFVADAAKIGTYGQPNFEALAAATPDLIVGTADEIDQPTYDKLAVIAPTVIVSGDSRGDWQSLTQRVAEATGRTDAWIADRAAYEKLRDETRATYSSVIDGNTWAHFSFGDDTGQFSIQLPTGSTGNLVVDEMGMKYPPAALALPDPDARGYSSPSLEQLPVVFDGVTAALTFEQPNGAPYEGITAITDSPLFRELPVSRDGHVFHLRTVVTDYDTAQTWIREVTGEALQPLAG